MKILRKWTSRDLMAHGSEADHMNDLPCLRMNSWPGRSSVTMRCRSRPRPERSPLFVPNGGAGQFTLGTLTDERLASQASVKAKHLVQRSVQAPSGSGQRRGLVDPPPPRTCSLTGCSGAWCSNRAGDGRAHSMARSLAHDGAHAQGRSEPMPLHARAGFDVHVANTPRPTWASSKGPWVTGPSP